MSNLTLPSGIGDARVMSFLKDMRDKLVELEGKQAGAGSLESRVERLETTVTAAEIGLVDRVTALETPGA